MSISKKDREKIEGSVKNKTVFSPEFIPVNVRAMKKFNLTYTEALVHGFIKYYFSFGDQESKSFYFTNNQLADIIGKKKSIVSKAVNKLKSYGLIDVNLENRNDRGNIRYIAPNNIKIYQTTHSTPVPHPPSTTVVDPLVPEYYERENTKREYLNKNKIPVASLQARELESKVFNEGGNGFTANNITPDKKTHSLAPADCDFSTKPIINTNIQFDEFLGSFNRLFPKKKHGDTGGVRRTFKKTLNDYHFDEVMTALEMAGNDEYWSDGVDDDNFVFEPLTPYAFLTHHISKYIE